MWYGVVPMKKYLMQKICHTKSLITRKFPDLCGTPHVQRVSSTEHESTHFFLLTFLGHNSYYVHVEDLYVLDQQGEVAAFNTRTNPALQTNTWSYSEELGKQASPILPCLQAHPAF